jgi:hypothetical protein
MPHDYSITVRWTKGADIQHGSYELTGDLPELLERAYEKAIEDGKDIFDPERIDVTVIPRSPL